MLKFLRTIIGKKTQEPANGISRNADGVVFENGIEVPQSPPFAKGIRVVSREALIESQRELIDSIYGTLSLSRADFDKIAMPLIKRYAGWVHLLPASEAHHHKTAGGLFRHGLEAAFFAAQASRGCVFGTGSTPIDRRNNEPRWRLAAMCAGLLHDIGKPLTDVIVTDRTGEICWYPHLSMINEWADEHGITRYYIKWRDRRHKMHETFSAPMLGNIMTPEIMHYFFQGGPEIYAALADAVCGLSAAKPLAKIMIKADQSSVAKDLRENRTSGTDLEYGLPIERFIFDAIRSMINSGQWTTNTIGSRVWHFKGEGVFIALRQGAGELYVATQKAQVPGIPREADTIADILIDRGLAIPQVISETGATDRYWQFETTVETEDGQTSNISLVLLKLEAASLVFSTEPPAAIDGVHISSYDEAPAKKKVPEKQTAKTKRKSDAEEAAEAEKQIIDEQVAASKRPMDFSSLMDELKKTDFDSEDEPLEDAPDNHNAGVSESDSDNTETTDKNAPVEADNPASQPQEAASEPQSAPEEHSKEAVPVEKTENVIEGTDAAAQEMLPRDVLEGLISQLDEEAQTILSKLVGVVMDREQPLGVTLSRMVDCDHLVAIPHPSAIQVAFPDEDLPQVLSSLVRSGVVIPDPVFPTKSVHTINGDKYLIFNPVLERAIADSLDQLEKEVAPADNEDLFDGLTALPKVKRKAKKPKPKAENFSEGAAKSEPTIAPPAQLPDLSSVQADDSKRTPETNTETENAMTEASENLDASGFGVSSAELHPEESYDETFIRSNNDFDEEVCELEQERQQQKQEDDDFKKALLSEALGDSRITGKEISQELKKQIRANGGSWINEPVQTIPNGLEVSGNVLRVIAARYAGVLSEFDIKKALISDGWIVSRHRLVLKGEKTK